MICMALAGAGYAAYRYRVAGHGAPERAGCKVTMSGFEAQDLNGPFFERPGLTIQGHETYWSSSDERFLHWCRHLGSWSIARRQDLRPVQAGKCSPVAWDELGVLDLHGPSPSRGWVELRDATEVRRPEAGVAVPEPQARCRRSKAAASGAGGRRTAAPASRQSPGRRDARRGRSTVAEPGARSSGPSAPLAEETVREPAVEETKCPAKRAVRKAGKALAGVAAWALRQLPSLIGTDHSGQLSGPQGP